MIAASRFTASRRRLAGLAAALLLVAACGDTSSPTTAEPPGTTVAPATSAPTVTTAVPATTSTTQPAATTSTTVPPTSASTTVADPTVRVEVVVEDGSVMGGTRTVEVDLDAPVAITVTADVADEVHVHGYDVFADVAPGQPGVASFTAGIPGIFEVELEGAGLLLLELEVS